MIFLTVLLAAQIKAVPPNGATIFAQQCSVPYCHGAGGAASRAPALAGTKLTRAQLRQTISKGRPKLGMPAFGSQLNGASLNAVVSYILSLPPLAEANAGSAAPRATVQLTKQQADGRDLFFDSEKLPSCGTCHAVNGIGGTFASPISAPNFTTAQLDGVSVPGLVTAAVSGESPFPALRKDSRSGAIRLVDLSSSLPVVRTFQEGEVKISESGDWKHSSVVSRYSASELQSIRVWLRAVLPGGVK